VDEFTVHIYETSVDASFETRDMMELFKSLSRLIELYPLVYRDQCLDRLDRYRGYYMLYLVCQRIPGKDITGDYMDILNAYRGLPFASRRHGFVRFAMRVLSALRVNVDYYQIELLYREAEDRQRILMDLVIHDHVYLRMQCF
jgi:hypothetical protein